MDIEAKGLHSWFLHVLLMVGCALACGTAVGQGGSPLGVEINEDLKYWPPCDEGELGGACFDFQGPDTEGWHGPHWFDDRTTYVTGDLAIGPVPGHPDTRALEVGFVLPDLPWSATGIQWTGPVDLNPFGSLTAEVFLPEEVAGRSVAARFIIIAGEEWIWCQATAKTPLAAGQWTTLQAPLAGDAGLVDYWGTGASGLIAGLSQVQAIMIRIEGMPNEDTASGPATGSVFIDRVSLIPPD